MVFIKCIVAFIIWTAIGSVILGLLGIAQNFFDVDAIKSIKSNYRDYDKNSCIVAWSIFWPIAIIAVIPQCIIEIIRNWME